MKIQLGKLVTVGLCALAMAVPAFSSAAEPAANFEPALTTSQPADYSGAAANGYTSVPMGRTSGYSARTAASGGPVQGPTGNTDPTPPDWGAAATTVSNALTSEITAVLPTGMALFALVAGVFFVLRLIKKFVKG